MKSTKMISIAIISLCIISMLFTTVMVKASPDSTIVLESGAPGTAEWTNAEKKYGSFSVELSIPEGATEDAYAEVSVPVAISLEQLDLTTTYFWCKSTIGDWTPYFIFELETDDRVNTDANSSAGYDDFAIYNASASPEFQWDDGTWHSWDDTVTEFGASTLITRVYVELSGLQNLGEDDWGPFTSYVDYVVINDVPYDLEPGPEDATALLKDLKDEIKGLPNEDFKKPSAQRRTALCNKINAMIRQIEAGAYKGAMKKLKKDIRPKLDCDGKGDWLVVEHPELVEKIDLIISMLQTPL